jgi:hypothetical protein
MKTVVIKEAFSAYPNEKLRHFEAGEEIEVSDEFGDLILGKGLAREKAPPAEEPAKGKKESAK